MYDCFLTLWQLAVLLCEGWCGLMGRSFTCHISGHNCTVTIAIYCSSFMLNLYVKSCLRPSWLSRIINLSNPPCSSTWCSENYPDFSRECLSHFLAYLINFLYTSYSENLTLLSTSPSSTVLAILKRSGISFWTIFNRSVKLFRLLLKRCLSSWLFHLKSDWVGGKFSVDAPWWHVKLFQQVSWKNKLGRFMGHTVFLYVMSLL